MKKLTSFGKFTRKLRIDNGELLKDMALKLGVTPSYLSAVEIGKRGVPKQWEEIILNEYSLNDLQKKELEKAILYSANDVKLNTENLDDTQKELVFAFARKFNDLDEEQIKNIKKILSKNNDK